MRLWVKESGRDWGSRIIRTTCPGRGGSSIMRVRLDRGQWAARFFKARALAAAAIGGGKVEVGGARAKPAKLLAVGDRLRIRRGPVEYVVTVRVLSEHRGSPAGPPRSTRRTPTR